MVNETTVKNSCLFCQQTKLTKEDVYPRWHVRTQPETPVKWVHHRDFPSATVLQSADRHTRQHVQQGSLHTLRLKCVCAECNNTWMSRLQEAAKPIIQRMMLGESVLSEVDQFVLASWCTMTAFVFEHRHRNLSHSTQVVRERFAQSQTIPEGIIVWVARLEEAQFGWNHFDQTIGSTSDIAAVPSLELDGHQITAWPLGNVFFLVYYRSHDCFLTPGEPKLVSQIWPPQGRPVSIAGKGLTPDDMESACHAVFDIGETRSMWRKPVAEKPGSSVILAGDWSPAQVEALQSMLQDDLGGLAKLLGDEEEE